MYEFNSIQEALNYIFEDNNITVINIPSSLHPWFVVDEIRNALGYVKDNTEFTRNLKFRDEVVAVLNIRELRIIGSHPMNDGVTSYLSDISINRPTIMIISLPGLFEAIVRSRMPKAEVFQHWLYFVVLPTLYHNHQLIQQINDLNASLKNAIWKTNAYRNECIDLRKENRSLNKQMKEDDEHFYNLVDICQRYKNLLDDNGIYY